MELNIQGGPKKRNTFLVITVEKWLKSVFICWSYNKNKSGVRFLDHPVITSVWRQEAVTAAAAAAAVD